MQMLPVQDWMPSAEAEQPVPGYFPARHRDQALFFFFFLFSPSLPLSLLSFSFLDLLVVDQSSASTAACLGDGRRAT